MTTTFALTIPTATGRTAHPPRATWASALVEPVKDWVASAIGLPAVLPGKDGWYL